MKRWIVLVPVVALIGCGGASPQDAEQFVRDEFDERATVKSVLCDEIDGDRFECEVVWSGGAGNEHQRLVVDASDL